MAERDPQGRRFAGAVPLVAAAAVSGWAHWCFASSSPPSGVVAVVGGAVLIAGACVAYFVLAGGSGGFFGGLLLGLGLLLTVAAVDQAAARGEVATCVVREVHTKTQYSFGEGAPEKTLYRLVLRCPGGYPTDLKDDRALAAVGEDVRVAYDPERRVSPAAEGETRPWRAALCAVGLLALSTTIALRRRAPDQ
ncbi:hypothetical protein ABZX75_30340 [Streptomyces sp. NPDC003038]|uniref:hypothetical protein n=1 Tax=unclassified Streptomyces TaxID=2593676 RepID=UPI00339E60D0